MFGILVEWSMAPFVSNNNCFDHQGGRTLERQDVKVENVTILYNSEAKWGYWWNGVWCAICVVLLLLE